MKERLKRTLDAGIAGLAPAVRRWRPRRLILCYHRIGGSGPGGTERATSTLVPAPQLEAQLRWLASFCRFRSLDELVTRGEGGDGWEVAVTFDDGYRDNLDRGRPLFERYAVPMTWFIATDFAADPERVPWWDLTAHLAEGPAIAKTVTLASLDGARFSLGAARDRRRLCERIERLHEEGPWRKATAVTGELARQLRALRAIPPNAMARPADLREAARTGLFALAPHTGSHPNLALLSRAEQREEMERGRSALEGWVGSAAPWFAYPFGKPAMRDESSPVVARELGFRGAVTSEAGYLRASCDPFALPRLVVDGRWTLKRFQARVLAAELGRPGFRA